MSYSFQLDSAHGTLYCGFGGSLTDKTLKDYYSAAEALLAELCPGTVVFDLSGVTTFEISAPAVRELMNRTAIKGDAERIRIFVAPSYRLSCVAHLFQSETRPNLNVVRRLQEAWELLGLRKLAFRPLAAPVPAKGDAPEGAAAFREPRSAAPLPEDLVHVANKRFGLPASDRDAAARLFVKTAHLNPL